MRHHKLIAAQPQFQLLLYMLAGWMNRHQQQVIKYLQEEVRAATVCLARGSKLVEKRQQAARRKPRTVDAMEFCLSLRTIEVAEYEPELSWESKARSDRQLEILARAGFDTHQILCRGHASKILDLLFMRRNMKLASPRQVM